MIAHTHHTTQGTVGNAVKIISASVSRIRIGAACHAGVRFGADGILYYIQNNGGFSAIGGQWLVNGTASTFYVSRTIDSGTLTSDAGAGPLQINLNRDYEIIQTPTGIKTTTVTFDLADNITGLPIIDSGTLIFTARNDSLM